MEALRNHAAREGLEVLEEVVEAGHSGESLARPGMDRVRDLVAASGVSVVLAQDRDRFSREPAYTYLLRRELEEHGTKLKALNDRGDESPEGELTDGILDQLAKYEREKIAERTRRGKLRKAREGNLIAACIPNYGFRFNAAKDSYLIDEEKIVVVQRIFRMVGAEKRSLYAVKKTLEAEGVPTAKGAKYWNPQVLRTFIMEDVYKPHTYGEIEALVTPEVAARLDENRRYGIWWFNRRRTKRAQTSDPGPQGRVYRKKTSSVFRPKNEWIAVPVPDSGIPREWVDEAREALQDNRGCSSAGHRAWELSGGIVRCEECGRGMMTHSVIGSRTKSRLFYYRCRTRLHHGTGACPHTKCHRGRRSSNRRYGRRSPTSSRTLSNCVTTSKP